MSSIYFASDFHLGVPGAKDSVSREKSIVRWLDMVSQDAESIYLCGDLFDFWFEYDKVIPKGHARLLGKLAELTDGGLPVFVFTGNHDMWNFRYFEEELGLNLFREPQMHVLQGKKCMIGHGDGLGPGDHGYKMIKKVFSNKLCQWFFARIHPNTGIRLAEYWSGKSRYTNQRYERYEGKEKEWLYQYCNDKRRTEEIDYFIFGHRHIPLFLTLYDGKSVYCNLGEWLYHQSFGKMTQGRLELAFFENERGRIFMD